MLGKIGNLFASLKGWTWIVGTLVPTGWTLASGLLSGVPMWQLVPWIATALAAGVVITYYGMLGFELVTSWYGSKRVGNELARQCDELTSVGQTHMQVGHAADLWAGNGNAFDRLICLRRIKQAADCGMIAYRNPKAGRASQLSEVAIVDLSKFFRERLWTTLPPLKKSELGKTRRITSVQRTGIGSWVRRW